jgi:hypothetical protein
VPRLKKIQPKHTTKNEKEVCALQNMFQFQQHIDWMIAIVHKMTQIETTKKQWHCPLLSLSNTIETTTHHSPREKVTKPEKTMKS